MAAVNTEAGVEATSPYTGHPFDDVRVDGVDEGTAAGRRSPKYPGRCLPVDRDILGVEEGKERARG